MAEKTDLNISPYYDDYNEDNNFQKVLYRAGRPLQARELTQSQSILQNQIERFGDHFFKEGSIVSGAQCDVDMDLYYVKVKSANPNSLGDANIETFRTASHGLHIQGKTSGVIAKIITSSAETSDDKATLFVYYLQQGTNTTNDFSFTANEELQIVTLDGSGNVSDVSTNNNDFQVEVETQTPNGRSSISNISEGVVFSRGFFVRVPKQELILEKYSGKPSYKVGLSIVESFIDSGDTTLGQSLLDNATGTSNENAAGADRFKIALTLTKQSLTTSDDTNFIELTRVNQGIIELHVNRPVYNEIENTLARRTFDANGDFVVRQFTQSLREHLDDTTNRGFYTAVNGGKEDQFVMQVSPGKAYVKGYEVEKIGTSIIPVPKARSTATLASTNTPIRLGNKLRVTKAHSLPEFGNEAGTDAQDPFQPVELFPSVVAAQGAKNSENPIGLARVRDIVHHSGADTNNVYGDDSQFDLSMFDIKMFTQVSFNSVSASNEVSVGDKVNETNNGVPTGASGIVALCDNTNNLYMLHDVIGTFKVGMGIESKGISSSTKTNGAITAVRTYNIDRVRSIYQEPLATSSREEFTANVITNSAFILTGTTQFTGSSTALTGFGTAFTRELKEGDIVFNPAGSGEERIIASVTDNTAAVLTAASSSAFQGNVTRRRAALIDQDQSASIFSWPRDFVKSHTPDQVQVRRQQVVTVASQQIQLSVGSAETFSTNTPTTDDLTIAVIEAGSGASAKAVGDLLNVEDYNATPGTGTLTISGFHANDNNAVLKVTYTVDINTPQNRDKTLHKNRCLKIGTASGNNGFYGTNYDDKEISLGVSDVFKVRGIFEGVDNTPLTPSATFTVTSGTFKNHEVLVGQTSEARAILITNNGNASTNYFYYTTTERFIDTEVIAGKDSLATATLSNVNAGSPDITSRYFFDDGQRDGMYDTSKLTLKSGEPVPQGPILIVYDYFTASNSGDFYDVNSYSNIDYKDIPVYSPSRVDLGGLEPDGTFELSDCVDFRPNCGQIFSSTTFKSDLQHNVASPLDLSNTTSGARYSPFAYDDGRSFASSRTNITEGNSNAVDTPVNGSNMTGSVDFYVGRIDKVFMHKTGQFMVSTGIPSLTPTRPKAIDDAIEMFEIRIPPYTNKLKDIRVRSHDHRRYTMKDIGKINNRVTNLERITALSLLEKDTQTKQILDADGFDRFKSGFLVDNFRGHRVGDVNHPDYNASIDAKLGVMRPKGYSQFFDIELDTTASSNYTKTGDLITLPFSELSYVNQDKASRQLNVNPYHVFAFDGQLKLTPGTDIWQDTDQLPEVRVNREGNFDAVIAENTNALGTVWNNWQTTWAGEPSAVSSEVQATSNGSWSGDPAQGGEWTAGLQITREITETPETQTRTGVTTSVVEDFVETRNDRVVSISMIPFMRARTIEIDATNLKPGTNHFIFFDNLDVNKFVRPYSSAYSQDGGTTVTSGVKTDGNGRCRAYFELPNNNSQRFPSGMREMMITASKFNLSNPASSASVIYQAQGLLQSSQTEIVSTRNGRVITERTKGERQFTRRGENINATEWDTDAPEIPVNDVVVTPPSSPIVPPVEEPVLPIEAPIRPPQLERFPPLNADRRFMSRLDGGGRGGWKDPLAQSFMCEPQGGMFLSSIDLYFASKSDNLPVSVEIRNMVNGYPGQTVLPFSVVTKNPGEVNTSSDGSVVTTFTFESPVYIEEREEMCFVVLSNSNDYEVFISRMGESDIISGDTISGQPYAGSLFLSQNASTWTAEQTDDMKFNMKICSFDTSKAPDLRFNNIALPTHKLQNNPVEAFSGKNFVKVYNYSHGMYDTTSSVVIAGLTGDKQGSALTVDTITTSGSPSASTTFNNGNNYIQQSSTDGNGTGLKVELTTDASSPPVVTSVKIADPGQGHAVGDIITISNFESTHDCTFRIASVGETIGGMPVGAINATFAAIKNIGIDSFCVTPSVSGYDFVSNYTAPASTVSGGSVATSTRNYYFDTLHTMIPNIQFKNTRIYSSVYMAPMQSPEGFIGGGANYVKKSITEFITLNDNSHFSNAHIVASAVNESANNGGAKSFTAQLQLQSFNSNLSPVIDVGTLGAIGIMNRLNNIDSATSKKVDTVTNSLPEGTVYVSSEEPEGDNNAMVYCTRKVNLKTPATAIRVTADLFKPATADIKFMFKILKNDESTPWDDLGWEFFNTDGSPDSTLESDARNFKEYDYTAEGLAEFSSFAIKVVGQGTNTCEIPLVSALRCIALAT